MNCQVCNKQCKTAYRWNQHINSNAHQQKIIGKPVCPTCVMPVLGLVGAPPVCSGCDYARKPKCTQCAVQLGMHNYPPATLLCVYCNAKHVRRMEVHAMSHEQLVNHIMQLETSNAEMEYKIDDLQGEINLHDYPASDGGYESPCRCDHGE